MSYSEFYTNPYGLDTTVSIVEGDCVKILNDRVLHKAYDVWVDMGTVGEVIDLLKAKANKVNLQLGQYKWHRDYIPAWQDGQPQLRKRKGV
jgi:hypothetical protein